MLIKSNISFEAIKKNKKLGEFISEDEDYSKKAK